MTTYEIQHGYTLKSGNISSSGLVRGGVNDYNDLLVVASAYIQHYDTSDNLETAYVRMLKYDSNGAVEGEVLAWTKE